MLIKRGRVLIPGMLQLLPRKEQEHPAPVASVRRSPAPFSIWKPLDLSLNLFSYLLAKDPGRIPRQEANTAWVWSILFVFLAHDFVFCYWKNCFLVFIFLFSPSSSSSSLLLFQPYVFVLCKYKASQSIAFPWKCEGVIDLFLFFILSKGIHSSTYTMVIRFANV